MTGPETTANGGPAPTRYIPFDYSNRCKRDVAEGYSFLRGNLTEDFPIILIAFAPLAPQPLLTALALLSFHLSLWVIYEAGYVDNDRMARQFELEPKLPNAFERFDAVYDERLAWIWAMALAVPGALLTAHIGVPYLAALGWFAVVPILVIWAAVLGALRGVYYMYNRIDKMSRVYLYLPLQLFKYGFAAVFFAPSATAVAMITAQLIRQWVPYIVYRTGNRLRKNNPARVWRLLTYIMIWLLLLPGAASWGFVFHGLLGLGWYLLRSAGQLRQELGKLRRVRDDTWTSTS
ncbi:MAG: hypothetical protein AAF848_14905 [Pseudomonadota bacterium]